METQGSHQRSTEQEEPSQQPATDAEPEPTNAEDEPEPTNAEPADADADANSDAADTTESKLYHMTTRALWRHAGLTIEEAKRATHGMPYGRRIHFLLNNNPSICPESMWSWDPHAHPPNASWAPGWWPINRQTVSTEDTCTSNVLCQAIQSRMSNVLTDDLKKVNKGIVLREEDSPAGRYLGFADLIGIYNASLGYCFRCKKAMMTKTSHNVAVDENSTVSEAWSAERIENFLMHLRSNVIDRAICV